jgi:secretion/DNA translocation related TadE-like protein
MLLIAVAGAGVLRTAAVLARHRVEAAADLAALAAAGQIGVASDPCGAAGRIAAANGATLRRCVTTLAGDGRSGSVTVTVGQSVRLPLLGPHDVSARARAVRDPAAVPGVRAQSRMVLSTVLSSVGDCGQSVTAVSR